MFLGGTTLGSHKFSITEDTQSLSLLVPLLHSDLNSTPLRQERLLTRVAPIKWFLYARASNTKC